MLSSESRQKPKPNIHCEHIRGYEVKTDTVFKSKQAFVLSFFKEDSKTQPVINNRYGFDYVV